MDLTAVSDAWCYHFLNIANKTVVVFKFSSHFICKSNNIPYTFDLTNLDSNLIGSQHYAGEIYTVIATAEYNVLFPAPPKRNRGI